MAYKIRQIDPDEYADELLEMQRACLPQSPAKDPEDAPYWWGVFFGGVLVGFAALRPAVTTKNAGYLCRAGVLPSHRGHGLQRRLIRVRERKAKALGWEMLVTDTFKNPHSANNIAACGFKIFTPKEPWTFAGSIYWRKAL